MLIKIFGIIVFVLILLIWLVWIGGTVYYLFRLLHVRYEYFERTGWLSRRFFAPEESPYEKRETKKYLARLLGWFCGFGAIEFALAKLVEFLGTY